MPVRVIGGRRNPDKGYQAPRLRFSRLSGCQPAHAHAPGATGVPLALHFSHGRLFFTIGGDTNDSSVLGDRDI